MIEISLETPALGGRVSKGGLSFSYNALSKNLETSPPVIKKAIISAIEQATSEAQQIAIEHFKAKLDCNDEYIRSRVRKVPVLGSVKYRGRIKISAKRIDLKHFRPVQTARGVRIGTVFYRGAFGPNIPRLGRNVFNRVGKDRLPIRKRRGVSLVAVARRYGINEAVRIQFQYRARVYIERNMLRAVLGLIKAA